MKRKVLVLGIGAGNPDYVTIQAVDALNRVNVFFIPNKGIEKDGLARVRVRREICERFIRDQSYRTVEFGQHGGHAGWRRRLPECRWGRGSAEPAASGMVDAISFRRLCAEQMSFSYGLNPTIDA